MVVLWPSRVIFPEFVLIVPLARKSPARWVPMKFSFPSRGSVLSRIEGAVIEEVSCSRMPLGEMKVRGPSAVIVPLISLRRRLVI